MLALLAATVAGAAGAAELWCGSLDYGPYAKGSPLNVSLTGATATISWVYDTDAGGNTCTHDEEPGLKVVRNSTTIMFDGTGANPDFYSFEAKLDASGTHMTGSVLQSGNPKPVGSFTAVKNGPPNTKKCIPKPRPPPPPPPPPPRPTTHALLWPLPKTYTNGSLALGVDPAAGAGFFTGAVGSKLLAAAFERYAALTFPHATSAGAAAANSASGAPALKSLKVSVASLAEDFPQLETDESYELAIAPTSGATLTAKTVFGALRGLETFSQLVMFDFDSGAYTLPYAPWKISDTPRFPHRGLMIDSARHFEPIETIKKLIDSLTYAKLNVLHWHMSDTQSFPFEVTGKGAGLWNGAYSSQEKFTQLDVRGVVEYARLRGVRVIVEFDMPGHAGSWCTGHPEICPSASCLQPLNVANNATFELIEDLLQQCTGGVASAPGKPSPGVFKDNFVHLGGDEVDTSCWTKTPAIAAWLTAQNMTADDGYAYFVKRVAEIAIAQGHRPVQWSEVFDHFKDKLDKKVIIHIWKSVTNVTEPLADGYNAIVNVGYDALSWYLDNLGTDWEHVYMNEPCTGVPDYLCPMVLGGHGEMWGETVDTSDLQQTVWPRLAAVAERLWSPRALNDTTDARDRIRAFRCLLNRRDVAAAPPSNSVARSAPKGPGGCYDQ